MARPLREQFLVATLVLVVPVIVIMVLFGQQTYRDQVVLLGEDAYTTAATVAVRLCPSPPYSRGRNSPVNLCSTRVSIVSHG